MMSEIRVLYDGRCVLCRQSKQIMLMLDWFSRIEFVDIHDRQAAVVAFPQVDFSAAMGQMHILTPVGDLIGGFAAVRRVLRELPLGFPIWLALHLPGMNWAGERVYRWVARHRYQINRLFGVSVCADGTCHVA